MIDDTILKNYQFLKSWIEERTDNTIKNITLERQILAFYLLEKLILTNVEFIFKGGTALILLLEETKRFSTDIDILISRPDLSKLENLFSNFVRSDQVFTKFERDLRQDSKFPKAHYKFFFSSIYKNDDQDGYILLDAVFEDNPYLSLESRVVRNTIFPSTEPYIAVRIPSITDILVDKLTAFAPKTIGVKFERISDDGSRDHSREVIKQWFDINELYRKCDDLNNLQARYIKLSKFEIEQRELSLDYVICLNDTFDVVLNYLSKGKKDPEVYNKITKGIRRLNSFVNIELTGSYFISASVNVIELISKVLCDDDTRYQKILTDSKERLPYEEFTRTKQLKKIVDLVKANNKLDWERFIMSVRVINEFFEI
jgi:predicted nucleotidyltransferase component of viral defense system